MNKEPEVTIFLTPIDAELFKKFQKHHALFKLLVEQGVFEVRNGGVVLNFDHSGEITTIERHDLLYTTRKMP
jgi:hypothetical protein